MKRAFASAVATAALLLSSAGPAFASTEITISGNGANSTNTATVTVSQTTRVVQNNEADIHNDVDAEASTGGNTANFNNGGSTTVTTGNATSSVEVSNTVNSNSAEVNCCVNADVKANISGNAAFSDNDLNVSLVNNTSVYQTNDARVNNDVDADARTGGNTASFNNGGSTTVNTGSARSDVNVSTTANANVAQVGGPTSGSGSVRMEILNNAAFSHNTMMLSLLNSVLVSQDNNAYIHNDVDADASTGGNTAKFNNGGNTTVNTGSATVNVGVDNLVNFNSVDVDCGCILAGGVTAKIAGNAFQSDNDLIAWLAGLDQTFQENDSSLRNELEDLHAKTGHNNASFNNEGGVLGDPTVDTGDSTVKVSVENTANANDRGDVPSVVLGNIHLTFSLAELLAWLSMH